MTSRECFLPSWRGRAREIGCQGCFAQCQDGGSLTPLDSTARPVRRASSEGTVKRLIKRIPILNSWARRLVRHIQVKRYACRLRNSVRNGEVLRLVIGAAGKCDPGWIVTERECLNLLKPEHWRTYFQKSSIDAPLAEHVWEHLDLDEGLAAAKLCFEYLKPGGYLRVAVPDGFHPQQAVHRPRRARRHWTGCG